MSNLNKPIGLIVTLLAIALLYLFAFGGFEERASVVGSIISIAFICFGVAVLTLNRLPILLGVLCFVVIICFY